MYDRAQIRAGNLRRAGRATSEVRGSRYADGVATGEDQVGILNGNLDAGSCGAGAIGGSQAYGVSAWHLEHVRGDAAGRRVLAQARRAPGAATGVTEVPSILELVERPAGRVGGRACRVEKHR